MALGTIVKICIQHYFEVFDEIPDCAEAVNRGVRLVSAIQSHQHIRQHTTGRSDRNEEVLDFEQRKRNRTMECL